ncbi:MAG: hypothetical protein JWQ01_4102 [Massilia sp.]|nr:hypothetical protein [Massilia sp.]
MNFLKPVLTALVLALPLVSTCTHAQEQPPADKSTAELPLKPVPPPNRKPIKRRSVQQVIEPTMPIVTEGYRPTLVVRPPAALPTQVPSQPPVRMNSCDAGGCTDTGGARYNSGVGNTLTGPQGQLCTKGLVNAQCF